MGFRAESTKRRIDLANALNDLLSLGSLAKRRETDHARRHGHEALRG
jgi:hypothetical protein